MQHITYREALHQAMDEEMEKNPDVILMGEDITTYGGSFKVIGDLHEKYGDNRVRATPISESTIVGAAAGAAVTGLRPVVEIMFGDFITYAMDALVNQAAKMSYLSGGSQRVPMVVRLPSGSGTGAGAQHSQNFESWFAGVPGLKVVEPATPAQAKGLLKAAIEDNNPVVFVENKTLYDVRGPVPDKRDFILPLGKTVTEHEGSDVTIVAWGPALLRVLDLVGVLEREGISADVLNPLTLYPMDMQPIYHSVMKTARLVIVHDSPKTGGIGAEIAARVIEHDCFNYLDAPIKRVAGADVPVPFNKTLEALIVPRPEDILDAVYEVTGMK